MYHCNLLASKRYYLRLLLIIVKGPQLFEHLCTINGVIHEIFHRAYMALELTHNDSEWIETFKEAVTFASKKALQRLLITALIHGDLANALTVWNQFWTHFCDNLNHQIHCYWPLSEDLKDSQVDLSLYLLNELLLSQHQSLMEFYLPMYQHEWQQQEHNCLINNKLQYSSAEKEWLGTE